MLAHAASYCLLPAAGCLLPRCGLNQMAELFQTTKQNVSLHTRNIFAEGELDINSVVKDFLTTATDGKQYKTKYYNLDVIISVGYRVKSHRGT